MRGLKTLVHGGLLALGLMVTVLASGAWCDVSITLKNDFIEQHKNRATMDATYSVVKTHHQAKSAKEDGDIHCAGLADEIGLACVAEVMNAKDEPAAVQTIVGAEGGGAIPLVGVWRVWPEHATGGPEFVQGEKVDKITSTNPPHVFELHPLVTVKGTDVRGSFKPIKGYTYKKAADAFARFEQLPCAISSDDLTTTIVTNQIGYNYVDFTLELLEDPTHELDDGGLSVYASVPGTDPEVPLVSQVRCVFVSGTAPFDRIKKLHAGDHLRVLGIPRVDLALLQYRAAHAHDRPALLNRTLPYEMIIVAVLQKK